MSIFKLADNEFEVRLTVGAVDRVKELTTVDLLDGEAVPQLFQDGRKMIAVLAATIKPQLDAKSISPADFLELLDSDAVFAGIDAMSEAIINFTPPEFRATRRMIVEKIKATNQLRADKETARMDLMEQMLAKQIEAEDQETRQQMEKMSESSFGKLPGKSG